MCWLAFKIHLHVWLSEEKKKQLQTFICKFSSYRSSNLNKTDRLIHSFMVLAQKIGRMNRTELTEAWFCVPNVTCNPIRNTCKFQQIYSVLTSNDGFLNGISTTNSFEMTTICLPTASLCPIITPDEISSLCHAVFSQVFSLVHYQLNI